MIIHEMVESLGDSFPELTNEAYSAVRFDCGEYDEMPQIGEFVPVHPPFPFTYIEFQWGAVGGVFGVFVRQGCKAGDIHFRWFAKPSRKRGWLWNHPVRYVHAVNNEEDGLLFIDGVRDVSGQDVSRTIAIMIFKLFVIMACSNVIYADHEAPAALNKKRQKKGKCPLFSYKTLAIRVPNERVEGPALGGTHATPRVHLRRGHIRRISPEKTVWVQASVVGAKHGMVSKDYRLVPTS